MENEAREIFNPEEKTLDFRKMRVTDMPHNQRVQMPTPRPQEEEKILEAKELIWRDEVQQFINNRCKENGEQTKSNLKKLLPAGNSTYTER